MDEPSAGLHPRDMEDLFRLWQELLEAGNSLVVIDNDPMILDAACWIIEMGPGSGPYGGKIVFEGTSRQFVER